MCNRTKSSLVFLLGLLAEAGCIIPRIDTAGDDFCCQSIGVIFREQDDATKPRDAYLALRGIKMHEDVSMRGSAEAVCGLLLQKGKVEAKKLILIWRLVWLFEIARSTIASRITLMLRT